MKILAKALQDDSEFNLELELLTGHEGLTRAIEHPRIQKPGLAMAGLTHKIDPGRLQVLGKTEVQYLQSLSATDQIRCLEVLFQSAPAAVVVTTGLEVPPALLRLAQASGIVLFRTQLTSGIFINRIHDFFDEHLSPEITLHGVLIDVFGVGALLLGQSGIGKSECALDLILRGHRLVADDVVVVRKRERELIGRGSSITRHLMEVRGLGIINVRDLFGAASVRDRKRIELLVEMLDWQHGFDYDRTGIDDTFENILGLEIPKARLPMRPGRNVASIVEVAARNHLLKQQGHHSARQFKEALERKLAEEQTAVEAAPPMRKDE